VALELKYHPACLAALYNKERLHLNRQRNKESTELATRKEAYPTAFSELVTYIIETNNSSSEAVIFRLADLISPYKERLEQLGVPSPDVNATRLKEQLLSHVPQLEAHRPGRDVLLAFRNDAGSILTESATYSEAVHLAKAAAVLRREMLGHKSKFDFTLSDDCLEKAIPPSLLEFVCMIEHGADIKSQLKCGASKSDLALAQLLQYNCSDKYKEGVKVHRHSKDRETPFAVYVGLSVFAKTRKRKLVDMLFENGISISYDRVLQISAQLGEAVITQYFEDGVVCPPSLRKGLFTTSALDNIDHNPTATTATTSFHGTSVSIFQHPNFDNAGEERSSLKVQGESKVKKVPELPEAFTNVAPAYIATKPTPPTTPVLVLPAPESFKIQLKQEFTWLEVVDLTEKVDNNISVTWSAHHATQKRGQPFKVSITSLLPLLRDEAHSIATIKHVLEKIKETVRFLNPGQTPVVAADQPLYSLAKQIQWQWPEYGEDKVVMMFGGLHIEMAALKSIGSLLQDSGWTSPLVEAGVASSGTAESYLSASSVTRTRQAHQITACCLYKQRKAAYNSYSRDASQSSQGVLDFEEWCKK